MAPDVEQATLHKALREMESRMMETINAGHAALTLSIAALTDMHHRAILEQEKRNSEFARRDRVDDIARRVDQHDGQLGRLVTIEQSIDKLTTAIGEVEQSIGSQTTSFATKLASFLATALLLLTLGLLTYILAHLGAKP